MFKIADGRPYFYQWDVDRKLIIKDRTITEVHFCNKMDNCSLVCETYEQDGAWVVNVPNILLQTDWRIRVYAYDGSYTKHSELFHVKSRSKPADYVYTETEVKSFEKLEEEMRSAIQEIKDNAPSGKSAYQVAVENGFKGTEEEWLNSLKGRGIRSLTIDNDTGYLEIIYTNGIKQAIETSLFGRGIESIQPVEGEENTYRIHYTDYTIGEPFTLPVGSAGRGISRINVSGTSFIVYYTDGTAEYIDVPQLSPKIEYDDALSETSTNAVQNKVITAELNKKLDAPTVTAEDDGKVLMVVDGALTVTSLPIYNGEVIE